jgi:hypothetical protein
MDKSIELRWFSMENFSDVEHWFKRHGKAFKNVWERSDFYVHLDGYTKLSFKIREGKAEIKSLIESSPLKVSDTCSGIVEHWIKWSKSLKDNLTAEQMFKDEKQLIELKKERMLVTYSINNKNIMIVNESVNEGCQVELTRLSIHNRLYHSFAFEAFGSDANRLNNLKDAIEFVFQQANMKSMPSLNDSYSYPELISNIVKID